MYARFWKRIMDATVSLLALLVLALSVLPKGVPAVNPATGDTSNPTLLIALAAVSLVGIVVVAILLLRPKKKGGKYQKKDK